MNNIGIGTSQKSCHNIRKTVISELRDELGVGVAARMAGHTNLSTTDKHYCFLTKSAEKASSKYFDVLEKKVPIELKAI